MTDQLKLALACDHAGFSTKEKLKDFLKEKGHQIVDFGCDSEQSCDYADYAHPFADAIEQKQFDFGFALCGSGNGINMTINKHQGVRAALCWQTEIAQLARQHNNANVCTIPARFVSIEDVYEMAQAFLSTAFEGGRHALRVEKIPVKR